MSETSGKAPPAKAGREERLAARLRENLRRRKAQARALGTVSETQEHGPRPSFGSADDTLPKPPAER